MRQAMIEAASEAIAEARDDLPDDESAIWGSDEFIEYLGENDIEVYNKAIEGWWALEREIQSHADEVVADAYKEYRKERGYDQIAGRAVPGEALGQLLREQAWEQERQLREAEPPGCWACGVPAILCPCGTCSSCCPAYCW